MCQGEIIHDNANEETIETHNVRRGEMVIYIGRCFADSI